MKIIRLTSTNNSAIFDGTINGNLVIPPNGKLALQSTSVNLQAFTVTIDFQTDAISYQIADGVDRSLNLQQATYTDSTISLLLQDLQRRLNHSCDFKATDASKKMMGIEWVTGINSTNGFVQIEYQIGKFGEHQAENQLGTNVERTTTNGGTYKKKTGQPATTTVKENCIISSDYLSVGNSLVRARVGRLETEAGADDTTGFVVGLLNSANSLDPNVVTNSEIVYGIRARMSGANRVAIAVVNGVEVPVTQTTMLTYTQDSPTNNEYLDMSIEGSEILFNLYRSDGTLVVINRVPYENTVKYVPILGIYGSPSNAQANYFRYIPSAYNVDPATAKQKTHTADLTANPTPSPPNTSPNDINTFNFQSIQVANFLGFENSSLATLGGISAGYEADGEVYISQEADSYIVELLNLPTICYDTYSDTQFQGNGQRKNILAVIPATNQLGKLVYSEYYPIFIDLDNKEEITLRNIKLRIVKNDYSPIRTVGLNNIVLLLE